MCFVHWYIVNYSSLVNSPNVKDWSLRSFIPPDKFCKVTKYDVVSYQEKESCDKTVASQLHSNSDFMLFMCLCIQNEKCWLMTKRDFRTSEWEILYLCGILRLILDQGFRFSLALAKFLQACLDVGSYVTCYMLHDHMLMSPAPDPGSCRGEAIELLVLGRDTARGQCWGQWEECTQCDGTR